MLTKENKKLIKEYAKRLNETKEKEKENIDGLIIHRIESESSDYVDHTFYIKAEDKEAALDILESNYYPVRGLKARASAYDCTGQAFCYPAKIKEVIPKYFLVKLHVMYDL